LLRDAATCLTFNNFTLCPHCIYVFCIYLRTNSDLCHLQHKLIGFITEMKSIYSTVRIGSSNKAFCALSLKGLPSCLLFGFVAAAFWFVYQIKKNWTNYFHAFLVYCSSHLLCKEQEGLLIIEFLFWSFLRSLLRPSRCILSSSTALIFYCPQVCEFSNVSIREVKRKLLQPYGTIFTMRHNDISLEVRFLNWDILIHTSKPARFSFQAYFACASNFWNTTRNLPALYFCMEMEFYWICCSAPYRPVFCKRAGRYSGATAVLCISPQGGGELSVIH
jgi:hypothetical protein